METVRRRFWVESGLVLACGALAAVTLVWRDWIERLTGWDPDQHSGWLEWLILLALLACCIAVGVVARGEWRRSRPTLSTSA